MHSFASIPLVLVLVLTLGLGPSRLDPKLSAPERLATSVALSFIMLYLLFGVLYVFDASISLGFIGLATILNAALMRNEIISLLRDPDVRRLLLGYVLFIGWMLLLCALIKVYSGGGWTFDWFEHYQRSLVFYERHDPASLSAFGINMLARPPLANVVTGFFLSITGGSYVDFQISAIVLSAAIVFPAALLFRHFGGGNVALVALALAFNPLVVQSVLYPWTKLCAAFFVLMALWFYLRSLNGTWRRLDLFWSGLFFAAGVLAHYSAALFAVAVAVHVCWRCFRGREQWRTALVALASSAALLSTWILWIVSRYDIRAVYASANVVTDNSNFLRVAHLSATMWNVVNTLIPFPLRGNYERSYVNNLVVEPALRDYLFLIYQTNAFFSLGSIAALVFLITLWKLFFSKRKGRCASEAWLWTWIAGTALVLGAASHPFRDDFGLAHVILQPLTVAGLVLVWRLIADYPLGARLIFGVGCLADLMFGILLHVAVQSVSLPCSISIGGASHVNCILKASNRYVFLGDLAEPVRPELWVIVLSGSIILWALGVTVVAFRNHTLSAS